ncbi:MULTISPECIES: hypothetical protein [unclassified Mesorhizobium]|uniref:hypothetical protein n=1 Tax=unclassified Mesorhizobium TaxID=325217 RepID=UPI00241560B6|nr:MULTISPECIES: hypothetical protein [unclassified Mesorhizobium]MDG4855400.1 hypothetical protein [Mesorhizobium sp. WSM4982]MDG4914774.1 hypothetical protein [Mesorhizobium sp. WSM4983]
MASGDRPNTARKPLGKKAVKLSQKEQSERFKKTARELEIDDSRDAFDRALEKIAKPAKRK